MGRYFILTMFVAAIGFVGYQIYGLSVDYRNLEKEREIVREEAETLTKENINLAKEIEYLEKPENLVKEIKSRFDYRFPGERTIIVAP